MIYGNNNLNNCGFLNKKIGVRRQQNVFEVLEEKFNQPTFGSFNCEYKTDFSR